MKLRIRLGLAVLAVVAVVLCFVRRDGFAVFVACGFGLFGRLNLFYGVLQSGFSMSPAITSSEMIANSAALFGRSQPARAPACRFCIVELAHNEPSRNVAVHVKEGGPSPRGVQEAFARRFDLPALSPDSSGESARPVAQLDRRLAEQSGRFGDRGPPPRV